MPEGIKLAIPTGYCHIRELITLEEWSVLKHGGVNIEAKRLIGTIKLEQTEWDRNQMHAIVKARFNDDIHDIAQVYVDNHVINSGAQILCTGVGTRR